MKDWPADDDRLLIALREGGETWTRIGMKVGRSKSCCVRRYQVIRKARAVTGNAGRVAGPVTPIADIHDARLTPKIRMREAERDARSQAVEARAEAEWQSQGCITSTYFGDPPPGWSALDRKRKDQHA